MLRIYISHSTGSIWRTKYAKKHCFTSRRCAVFVGIDLGRERVPDGAILLKFRRLLEKHALGAELFAQIIQMLEDRGLKVGTGTIADATIISAPSSTKNATKTRDLDMHQTRKGQQ